ncbi:Dynein heavy chain [Spironucleus salmonicida]|uniref:Dynein heavy chain n=1 Tax=Spironucleus salmonicida TaxID=348837 RepID=V6LBC6_9EUKA|nr:Dynein heavy chain [Spironucleus salmonicida]|eukprot:EST41750.1 Dynein heavy chain [Spironucleus salmonicida]
MPFIEQNIDKSLIRPQSHTGRLSSYNTQASTSTRFTQRPQSTQPQFAPSPEQKLYSSPPPAYAIQQMETKQATNMKINLKQYHTGGLMLPIELTNETAYMNRKPLVDRSEFNQQSGELVNMLKQRRVLKPQIGRVDQVENFQLSVEGQTLELPRPVSHIQKSDTLKYASNLQKKENTMDMTKRLEENSKIQLQNIKQQQSFSSYAKQLDRKIMTKKIMQKQTPQRVEINDGKQQKYALNDWIVKARAGTATNKPLRSKSSIQQSEDMNLLQDDNSITVQQNQSYFEQSTQEDQQKIKEQLTHKQLIESIIISVDDVLPIFNCIKERITLENIIDNDQISQEERIQQLKDIFISKNVHFSYALQYQAQLQGEKYYENIKEQYHQLLKTSPDIIANTLLQSEFVYLTFDTPEIRRYITQEYLSKNKQISQTLQLVDGMNQQKFSYKKSDPHQNCYELIVCAYNQIDVNTYYTISGEGITEFQDNQQQTIVTPLDQWAQERKLFLQLRKLRYFREFRLRKCIFMWNNQIKHIRKTRAFAAINRLSLQANKVFQQPMSQVSYIIRGILFDLDICNYKLYTFEQSNGYVAQMFKGNEKYKFKYYTSSDRSIITLVQFVNNWNNNLQKVNDFISLKVEQISEILLSVCRTVAQNIQARQLATSNKTKSKNVEKSSNAILSAISNATTFNMTKIKSLIKSSDYILAEVLLEKLVDLNAYLYYLFFGVQQLPIKKTVKDEVQEQFTQLSDEDRIIMEQYRKNTTSKHEYSQMFDNNYKTDFQLLEIFIRNIPNLALIASQELDEPREIYQFKFDRHNKKDQFGGDRGDYGQNPISAEINSKNLMTYLYQILTNDEYQELVEFKYKFLNIPLALMNNQFPPYPLFHIEVQITNAEFTTVPSRQDFIDFIGDALSEIATIAHRSIRPFSYPKLSAFLSETTRTSNLAEFMGLNIKDSLSVSEDYITSIRRLKQSIFHACDLVKEYSMGFNSIFKQFIMIITQFNYHLFKNKPQVIVKQNSILDIGNIYGVFEILIFFWQQKDQRFTNILYEITFPGLLNIENYTIIDENLEDPDIQNEQQSLNYFQIPQWNHDYHQRMQTQDSDYINKIQLIQPYQFKHRVAEINQYLVNFHLLKVERSILCFQVSSVQLFEQIMPLLIYYAYFVKFSLPLSIIKMSNTLSDKAVYYVEILQKVPDVPLSFSQEVKVPQYYDYDDCLFDFSKLYCYKPDDVDQLQTLKDSFQSELEHIRKVNLVKKQEAENQKKIYQEAQQLMQQKLKFKNKKSKKGEDKEDVDTTVAFEDNVEQEQDDEEVLTKEQVMIQRILEFSPFNCQVYNFDKLKTQQQQQFTFVKEIEVDKKMLDSVKEVIEIYELSRNDIAIYRESERKLLKMFDIGQEISVLDESGNIILDELSISILKNVFDLNLENTIKEQFKNFQNNFQILERHIMNFTIKKPKLYSYFKYNLLVLYTQLGGQIYEILNDILKKSFYINIYVDEQQFYKQHRLIIQGDSVQLQNVKYIQSEQQLYLYLLLQNTDEFGQNNYIYFSNLQNQQMEEQLQEIVNEEIYFNRCLQLFESNDFYISQNIQNTEIFFIIKFVKYIQSIFSKYWQQLSILQNIIKQHGALPISLLNTKIFQTDLVTLEKVILQIKEQIIQCKQEFLKLIDDIIIDQNGNISTVPQLENQIYNFSTLKFIVFIYKQNIKQSQMVFQEQHFDEVSKFFNQILDNERADQKEQINLEYDYTNFDQIFTTINCDNIMFVELANDALQYYFDNYQQVDVVINLIQKMIQSITSLEIMQSISFQPRHYQHLVRQILPTPDISYELHLFQQLITIPENNINSTLIDLLDKFRANAYRSIFDANGDGIQELLYGYLALQPRRETFQKQIINLKLMDTSIFSWEVRDTYIDVIEQLKFFNDGKSISDYLEQILIDNQQIKDSKADQQDMIQIKYYDTDQEQLTDFEAIQNKAQVHQNIIVTLSMHIQGLQQRLTEIVIRRRKYKNYKNYKYVRYNLSKGGLFQEMDRFTTSLSRLVFRNLFDNLDQVTKITNLSELEYTLLDKLSVIKTVIYDLRFKMSMLQNDGVKFNFISDATFVNCQLNDQLINLHTLQAQFKNLNSSDIELALDELMRLQQTSNDTLKTIKTLILCQNVVIQLFPIFSTTTSPINKSLPEETRTFQKYFIQFQELLQNMFESGCYAVKNCTAEVSQVVQVKIFPEFEQIQKVLESFLQNKRETLCRFYFLNNKLLSQILSIQQYEQCFENSQVILNNALDFMFSNVKSLIGGVNVDSDGQKRYIVTGILSQEGEKLNIASFSVRGQSEIWLSSLQMKIQTCLQVQFHNCFSELLYLTREFMGLSLDQYNAKQQKIELQQYEKKIQVFLSKNYSIQVINIIRQAIILFFIDNVEKYYSLEIFNLNFNNQESKVEEIKVEDILTLEQEQENEIKKIKQVKVPTVQIVITNLITFYQFFYKYIAQILKQAILSGNKLDIQKYQLLLQNDCYIINQLEMLDGFYSKNKDLHNYLTYYYNHITQQLYTIDFEQHQIYYKNQSVRLVQQLNYSNPQGILYGYEYLGLQSRAIQYNSHIQQQIYIYQQKLAMQLPILIQSPSGQGKTSFISDLAAYQGQFLSTIQIAKNTQSQEFINNIVGTCLGGTILLFEDINELQSDILSILSIYLQQITQSLRTYQLSFSIDKTIYKLMPSTQFFATIKSNGGKLISCLDQFKQITLLAPDQQVIIQQSLLQFGFVNFLVLTQKINFFFKTIKNQFIDSSNQFNSFRCVKQLLIIVQSTWKRWLIKFSKNDKLLSYFQRLDANAKQLKEQQLFNFYIEQYCVVFCLFQYLLPQFHTNLQYSQFNILINSIFDNDIVNTISKNRNSGKQLYNTSLRAKVSRTGRASTLMRSYNQQQLFSKQEIYKYDIQLLLNQLILTKHNYQTDIQLFSQQNIFLGEEDLKVTEHEMNLNDLFDGQETQQSITQKSLQSEANQQQDSLQDSLSGSGQFLQLSGQLKDDMFTVQVQNAVNIYITQQKLRQINHFIHCLLLNNLLIVQEQLNHYQEFEGALWYRTCVILRGKKGSGKTVLWQSIIDKTNKYIIINPESLSEKELFGFIENGYFSDGIIPQFIRQAYAQVKDTSNQNQVSTLNINFIIFNGYSDKLYRLLSAIDDSRYLQLQNSENLRIPNYIRIIFEVGIDDIIPDQFVQRCITVSIDGDYWRQYLHSQLKLIYKESYEQFIIEFDYDQELNIVVKRQVKSNQPKRYQKKDNVTSVYFDIYPINNVFYCVCDTFSQVLTQIIDIVVKHPIVNMLQIIQQTIVRLQIYLNCNQSQFSSYELIVQNQQIVFFALFHTIEAYIDMNQLSNKFKEIYDILTKQLVDILQLQQFNLTSPQDLFINFRSLIPFKIHEDTNMLIDSNTKWGRLLYLTNFNSNAEQNIATIFYDQQTDMLIVQNIQHRRLFTQLLMAHSYLGERSVLLITGYNAKYYNQLLYQQQEEDYQKVQFSFNRNVTLELFKEFFLSLFNKSIEVMIPVQELPLVIHLYDFQLANIDIQQFVHSIQSSGQQIVFDNFTYQQFNFIKFKFIISMQSQTSIFENQYNVNFIEYQLNEYETLVQQIILTWSGSSKFQHANQSIYPVFSLLSHFINLIIKSIQNKSNFKFEYFIDLLTQIFKIDEYTFADDLKDYNENLFDQIFKRQIYQSLISLIKILVFSPMQISLLEQNQLISDAAQKSILSQQIVELKQGPTFKLPIKYHSELLLLSSSYLLNSFLTTKLSIDIAKANNFYGVINDRYFKFIEADFSKKFQDQIISTSIIPKELQPYPDVYNRSEISVLFETPMIENRQRFFYVGFLLSNYKKIVVLDRPGYQTKFIYSQAAQRLSFKFASVGEQQQDQVFLYNKLVTCILQQLLRLVTQQDKQKAVIFISDEFLQNEQILHALNQIMMHGLFYQLFTLEPQLASDVLYHLRLIYDINGKLTDIQLKSIISNIIINMFIFVLAPEHDTYRQLTLKKICVIEKAKIWPVSSIAVSAINNLQPKYIQMKKLCSNIKILNTFILSFQMMVKVISPDKQFQNIILSPGCFTRFLQIYHKIYFMKRNQLGDKSNILQKGIELFDDGQKQTLIIQKELEIIQPQVLLLQSNTDMLLITLQQQQLEITTSQALVQSEERSLQVQGQSIDIELKQSQSDLDEVMPILQKAENALKHISRSEIAEISSFTNPKAHIILVMNALCVILNETPTWQSAKLLLSSGSLISQLMNLKPLQVPPRQFKQFKQIVSGSDFRLDKITPISQAAATLAQWCIAVINYTTAFEHIQPRINRLDQAKVSFKENQESLIRKKEEIVNLTDKMEKVKKSLDVANGQKLRLEHQMQELIQKLSIIEQLNVLLQKQDSQWKADFTSCKQDIEQLSVLALIGSVYTMIQFSQEYVILEQVMTKFILNELEFKNVANINNLKVYSFIADQEQQAQWKLNGLFGDQVTFSAMLSLSCITHCPYIIDPDLVFNKAALSLQLTFIKLNDDSMLEQLLDLLDQPKTVVIQIENVQNWFLPYFMKQLISICSFNLVNIFQYSTSQQTTKHYFDSKVFEINNQFQILFLDNTTTSLSDLCAEIFVNYQVISYIKDSQSLHQQIQNTIIEAINPSIEQQRLQIIKEQAQYSVQLQSISQQLIQQLVSFDFQKDLNSAGLTIINELKDCIETKQKIETKMQELDTINSSIEKTKEQYNTLSIQFGNLFKSISDTDQFYKFQHFIMYIKSFITEDQNVVFSNIIASLDPSQITLILFKFIAFQDVQTHEFPQILNLIQQSIVSSKMVSVYDKTTNLMLQKEYQINALDCTLQVKAEKLFAPKNQLQDTPMWQIEQRRAAVTYLIQGLFKTSNSTSGAQVHLTENSLFSDLCGNSLDPKQPLLGSNIVNYNENLQKQIVTSIQTKWHTHYLKIYETENLKLVEHSQHANLIVPKFFEIIYQICQEIINQTVDFEGKNNVILVFYLAILFIRLLKPEYFVQILQKFYDFSRPRSPFIHEIQLPEQLLKPYINQQRLQPIILTGDTTKNLFVLNQLLEIYQPSQKETTKFKPAKPIILISSLSILEQSQLYNYLANTATPFWVVLLDFELSSENNLKVLMKLQKQINKSGNLISQDAKLFLFTRGKFWGKELSPQSQLCISLLPRIQNHVQIEFNQYQRQLVYRMGERIQGLDTRFQQCSISFVKQFLTIMLHVQYQNINFEQCEMDFGQILGFYFNDLVNLQLSKTFKVSETKITDLVYLVFGSHSSIFTRRQLLSIIKFVQQTSVDIDPLIPQSIGLPDFRIEQYYSRLQTGDGIKIINVNALKDQLQASTQQSQFPLYQYLIYNNITINQNLDLSQLSNPSLLFQVLLIQAYEIYGFSPSEYTLIYSISEPFVNDLVLTNFKVRNGHSKYKQIRVLARIYYKRRYVYLPLFAPPKIQEKQASQKVSIKLPESRFSEFSVGPITVDDDTDVQVYIKEKSVKEKRFQHYLVGQVQTATKDVELRRNGNVLQVIQFEGDGDFDLLGTYLEI